MIRSCIQAIVFAFLATGVLLAQGADMVLVKQRIVQSLSTGLAESAVIQGHQSSLQSDGTWPDIDYASKAHSAKRIRMKR